MRHQFYSEEKKEEEFAAFFPFSGESLEEWRNQRRTSTASGLILALANVGDVPLANEEREGETLENLAR